MNKKVVFGIVMLPIFCWFTYNSKRDNYNNRINFYKNEISSIIYKIERTRGTKVYYGNNGDFFYLEAYKGIYLKEGDSIKKVNQLIKIHRKEYGNEKFKFIGTGEPVKQPSYFDFFFF